MLIKNIYTACKEKYDNFIYGLAYHAIVRIATRNPYFCYAWYQHAKKFWQLLPLSEEEKAAVIKKVNEITAEYSQNQSAEGEKK